MAPQARRHVSLFLAFGDRRIEVLTHGGLEGVCSQAEAALGLHPKSYDIADACGEVDSSHTLQRVMAGASGFCLLEVREKPEWKRMREMDNQIKALLEREASSKSDAMEEAIDAAVKASEQNILTHVDEALSEMRESIEGIKAKMQSTVSPMLETVAEEQTNLRAKLSGMAPLLKDLALEQMKARTAGTVGSVDELGPKVQAMEVEMNEQAITTSVVTGHLESGLSAAKKELETLRRFTAEQLSTVSSKVEAMELEMTEQAITTSSVNGHLECGLSAAKKELQSLRSFTADELSSMNSKVEAVAAEASEQAITTSAVTGHLECGLSAAKKELETLRRFTADQLSTVNSKVESVESETSEQAITTSAVTGHLECGLSVAKKELETLRRFTADQLSDMSSKVESMEVEMNEQAITASTVNGHLECGLSAAKQELESLRSFTTDQLDNVQVDVDFRSQVKAARLNSQEALAGLEALKKEVRRLANSAPAPSFKPAGSEIGEGLQWSDGFSTHTLSAIPYSKKALHKALQEADAAPFAHFSASRLSGSRSVPQLPAVS